MQKLFSNVKGPVFLTHTVVVDSAIGSVIVVTGGIVEMNSKPPTPW